ncbi:MAG: hypothetical protein K2M31_08850 [Muribaculaceae bacterium]|nr:hypothetical protein [Muribaculaceae bacterium]
MSKLYTIAGNTFCIDIDDQLEAWQRLQPRFRPFEAEEEGSEAPSLEIDVTTGIIPVYTDEKIYEPKHNEIGLVEGTAGRLPDGCLVMDFRHIKDSRVRLRLTMPSTLDRAHVILNPKDEDDPYFLSHAIMVAYVMATAVNGTLMIHASTVTYRGRAFLFQGKSGTGKSTHARMWTENVLGAQLLNDDNPLIRVSEDGVAMVYGSPWSGKTDCYRNESAPIGGFLRIRRADYNELRPIENPLKAYASLTASMFYLPVFNDRQREMRHLAIERLVKTVSCYDMYCRPDSDAAHCALKGAMRSNK